MSETTELIAFVDESRKPMRDPATGEVSGAGEHYVLAAVVLLGDDSNDMRRRLNQISVEIGHPLHYRELSRQRRNQALEAIAAITDWEGYIFETARPLRARNLSEHHVGAKLIGDAFTYLSLSRGAARAVLETRSHPAAGFVALDQKDHDVLRRLRHREETAGNFEITHASKAEPILQIADLLAGARSDWLCGVSREPHSIIAHRVRSTRSSFGNTP